MTPLTHHDIVRLAAPFTAHGLRVDLNASVRAERRVRFKPWDKALAGDEISTVHHELVANSDGEISIRRAVWHPTGIASVVQASGRDARQLAEALDAVPLSDQLFQIDTATCARSFRLWLADDGSAASAHVELTHLGARVQHLVLSIDVTTGGGMPAEATLAAAGSAVNGPQQATAPGGHPARQRRTLASGDWLPAFDPLLQSCQASAVSTHDLPPLPDDMLAILGTQWRPLRPYGDHFRTVLRELGRAPRRADRANGFFDDAVGHLEQVLAAPAEDYHRRFHRQRRAVFLRRLRPIFLLAGMLALMPVMYLAVNTGGMTLHPLMLGLTPLLMVAAIALSVREIPVMEWPAWPAPLPSNTFDSATTLPSRR